MSLPMRHQYYARSTEKPLPTFAGLVWRSSNPLQARAFSQRLFVRVKKWGRLSAPHGGGCPLCQGRTSADMMQRIMKDSTHQEHVDCVRAVRRQIGCGAVFEEALTRSLCVERYGRQFSDRTWRTWKETALTQDDAAELSGLSEATHCLLLAQATLRRGNAPGSTRNQVSRFRLAHAALRIKNKMDRLPEDLPNPVSFHELKAYVETQAMRTYSPRHHRRNGLKASLPFYSPEEVALVTSRYPNHRVKQAVTTRAA